METPLPPIHPDREINTERVLAFPQAQVFSGWATPEILAKWWGPAGFSNTFEEFEFRPGGRWKFVMHGPEKGNYQNECEFLRIEAPSLIHWQRISQPLFQVLTTFEELPDAKTKLVFRMIFDTPEACEKIRKLVVGKNEENFDKLEVELAALISTNAQV